MSSLLGVFRKIREYKILIVGLTVILRKQHQRNRSGMNKYFCLKQQVIE